MDRLNKIFKGYGSYNHIKTSKKYQVHIIASLKRIDNHTYDTMIVYLRGGKWFAREINEFNSKFEIEYKEPIKLSSIPVRIINTTNSNDGEQLNLYYQCGEFFLTRIQ